jgi:hypothetical protein
LARNGKSQMGCSGNIEEMAQFLNAQCGGDDETICRTGSMPTDWKTMLAQRSNSSSRDPIDAPCQRFGQEKQLF